MPIYEYTCSGCGRLFEQLVQSREQGPNWPARTAVASSNGS